MRADISGTYFVEHNETIGSREFRIPGRGRLFAKRGVGPDEINRKPPQEGKPGLVGIRMQGSGRVRIGTRSGNKACPNPVLRS